MSEIDFEDESVLTEQPVYIQVLRWVALVPGSLLSAWAVYLLCRLVLWLGSSRFEDETWFEYIFGELLSHGMMGYAFVFGASYIAPKFKLRVAIVFAVIAVFLSGMAAFASLSLDRYLNILSGLCLGVGGVIAAIKVYSDDGYRL